MTLIHRIVDAATGEINETPYSENELAEVQKAEALIAEFEAKRLADTEAKAALLARLGLTEDELKTILG